VIAALPRMALTYSAWDGSPLCRPRAHAGHVVVRPGHAVGSWIAGFALESTFGATGPVLVGTRVAALYFLPLTILQRKERAVATCHHARR
jgi:hypothetical protein